MRPFIPVYAALVLLAITQPGLAQTAPVAPPTVSAPAKPARVTRLEKRFEKANTTHDGHLTLEQAKAGKMPTIVTHFTEIDRGAKGYVTLDDIKLANANARAAKAAQKAATTKG